MDPPPVETSTTAKVSTAPAGSSRPRYRLVIDVLIAAGLANGLVMAIFAFGYVRYGDISSFLAAIRGDEVFVSVQALPERPEGESRQLAFNLTLKNLTARPFRVLGINDNCDCLSVEGIPTTIGARESKEMTIKVRVSRGQAPTTEVSLITDDANLNQIRVALIPEQSPG
jgi:hypothetical protein